MFKIRRRKFTGQKRLTLWLNPKVYDAASGFGSNDSCYLATAVKQQLTQVNTVSVASGVRINGQLYRVLGGNFNPDAFGPTGTKAWGCASCMFLNFVKENQITCPVVIERIV